MKKRLLKFSFLLISAFLFTGLLFRIPVGLNLPVFEIWMIGGIILIFKAPVRRLQLLPLILWVLTLASVVFINSSFAICMNIFAFVFFALRLSWHSIKHPLILLWLGIMNIYRAQHAQWHSLFQTRHEKGRGRSLFKILMAGLVITGVLLVFFFLYKASSSFFQESIKNISDVIDKGLQFVFGEMSLGKFMFFLMGFTVVSALAIQTRVFNHLLRVDTFPSVMQRRKRPVSKPGLRRGLITERNTGIALLLGLNLLILLQNALDIKNIWIDFKYDGKYDLMKQFVHEGTYILIVSIFLSILIVLYVFRRNQNFFKNNKWLRVLTYIWLFQNLILAISVGFRNFWYIYFYNLAYLRIGVFVFLLLVLCGIILVSLKIHLRWGAAATWSKGAISTLLILSLCSFIPWDLVIVKHNIRNSNRAYFHRDFMVCMPDKSLSIIKPYDGLFNVKIQTDTIVRYSRDYYGAIDRRISYKELLKYRYARFQYRWQQGDWRSWNYPDYICNRELAIKQE